MNISNVHFQIEISKVQITSIFKIFFIAHSPAPQQYHNAEVCWMLILDGQLFLKTDLLVQKLFKNVVIPFIIFLLTPLDQKLVGYSLQKSLQSSMRNNFA